VLNDVIEVADWTANPTSAQRARARDALESGKIVLFPELPFAMSEEEKTFLDPSVVKNAEKSAKGRPRIIYFPDKQKMLFSRLKGERNAALNRMVVRYADWARGFMLDHFPDYERGMEWGPTSFRPCSRAKPQRVHLDAFYQLPTQGRRLLRVFTNLNPDGQPRAWDISETFEPYAKRHVHKLKRDIPGRGRLLSWLHVTRGRQTAYDHAMLQLRAFAKEDRDYREMRRPETFPFPAGATWMCYTDAVLHGGHSGQHAFEQTFLLDPDAMYMPERSPLRLLENWTGRRLV
jgi:hypothetical protein